MQPTDIGRLVSLDDPRVSPDGSLIAFVVSRTDLAANRYRSAVWVAAADGSAPPYQLTSGEHGDSQPAWSPDGRRLAFTSRRGAESSAATLHVVPVGGPGEVLTLCERAEAIERPVWSSDGRRIAFASRERTGRYTDGDDDRARPPRRIDRLWSRIDGEGWIIDRPRGVFVVGADGSGDARPVAGGPYEYEAPVWSPDGRQLVTAVARTKDWDLELLADLHLVDVDGGAEPRALTGGGRSHHSVSWSPDGRTIASLTEDVRLLPSHGQVVVTDAATGEQRMLTADLDRQCAPMPGARPPAWDGTDHLLFSLEEHGSVHVYRIAVDGSGAPELLLGGTRVVRGFDLGGGTLAFVAATPTTLPELYVRDADGTERQLTSFGRGFLEAVPVREAEPFSVPSPAGDGDVDAWLVRPAEPAGEKTPVLLSIHGGPMSQYTTALFDEFQLWAGAGYAVVYCNPHGSTGHTEDFARSIRPPEAAEHPGTGWGGIDAQDVLAVLDAALDRFPDLDRERVGVLGGSYGGYLTTWMIANTDRFAAACSERAANNLESLEWASDAAGYFRHEFGLSHLDAPEVYRRLSPISKARDITTPTLILHSENDLRCSIEQADQLFVALRLLGRPVEYWRFPEEGHELSRSGAPRHRVQRAEIILDWFGRHLGGRRPAIGWDHPSRAES